MLRLSLNNNNNTVPTYLPPQRQQQHEKRDCTTASTTTNQQQQQRPSKQEDPTLSPSCLMQNKSSLKAAAAPATTFWWDDDTETNNSEENEEESLVIAITRGIENFTSRGHPSAMVPPHIRLLSRSNCFVGDNDADGDDAMEHTNNAGMCKDDDDDNDDGINLVHHTCTVVRFNELVRVSEFERIDAMYHPLLYYTKGEIQRMRDVFQRERQHADDMTMPADANQENTPPPSSNTHNAHRNDDDDDDDDTTT
jgi:hypothetical protein